MAKTPMPQSKGFSLAELIVSTADELREAYARPKQPGSADPVMEFKGCELELAVTVKGETGGGIRFWVIDASAKIGAERVSKIKLSFGPIAGKEALAFPAISKDKGPGPAAPPRQQGEPHG